MLVNTSFCFRYSKPIRWYTSFCSGIFNDAFSQRIRKMIWLDVSTGLGPTGVPCIRRYRYPGSGFYGQLLHDGICRLIKHEVDWAKILASPQIHYLRYSGKTLFRQLVSLVQCFRSTQVGHKASPIKYPEFIVDLATASTTKSQFFTTVDDLANSIAIQFACHTFARGTNFLTNPVSLFIVLAGVK